MGTGGANATGGGGAPGLGGRGGTAGHGGAAGNGGTTGTAGHGGTAGTAGHGGTAGTAGHGGTAGNGGTAGTAGHGGAAGNGGTAGTAGHGGTGGAGGSQPCGGTGDAACPTGAFCAWSDERCGAGLVHGVCKSPVGGVTCVQRPACGCDGKVYSNPCEANSAGTDLAVDGTCTPPTGTFECGWSFCTLDTQYCAAQVGGAVGNPGTYACTATPSSCAGSATCACLAPSFPCTQDASGGVTVTQEVP
jgi:hypothetical protein